MELFADGNYYAKSLKLPVVFAGKENIITRAGAGWRTFRQARFKALNCRESRYISLDKQIAKNQEYKVVIFQLMVAVLRKNARHLVDLSILL